MLSLSLDFPRDRAPRLLVLGAHSDDIEIGCGGTVRHLLERYPGAEVRWVVFAAGDPARAAEARAAAACFLRGAGHVEVTTHRFRDGFFPAEFSELKEVFEGLKTRSAPDLVLTHRRHDHHQDHRQVAELTWNTFRDAAVLEYEIPKYDPDLGNPNLFVPLTRAQAEEKVGNPDGGVSHTAPAGLVHARHLHGPDAAARDAVQRPVTLRRGLLRSEAPLVVAGCKAHGHVVDTISELALRYGAVYQEACKIPIALLALGLTAGFSPGPATAADVPVVQEAPVVVAPALLRLADRLRRLEEDGLDPRAYAIQPECLRRQRTRPPGRRR